jgi:hypothetical protein
MLRFFKINFLKDQIFLQRKRKNVLKCLFEMESSKFNELNKTGAEATQAHTSVFNALSTDLLTAKSFSGASKKKKTFCT